MNKNISAFCCPVCGNQMQKDGKILRCASGHCYDYAKSGYVNLLMSRQGRLHGDDRSMVRARSAFLSQGHFFSLLKTLASVVMPKLSSSPNILDAGCGEGWYTEQLHNILSTHGFTPKSVGVDISRDALSAAAKRPFDCEFAVASLYHIPLTDAWADLIINVFAPDCIEEFSRILKPEGFYLKIIPLEDHLLELKQAVYDSVYENEVSIPDYPEFQLISNKVLRKTIHLSNNESIQNLFMMTPYARKTSPKDIAKLNELSELDTTISFSVLFYQKKQ